MVKRDNVADEPVESSERAHNDTSTGKGVPTPSRREQEAARKRPIVPNDRKEAARQSRQAQAQAREKARVGMAAGDERYLTQRDRGPQRRYVRDFVDARYSFGEFLIPVLVIFIISSAIPTAQTVVLLVVWVYFLIAVVDAFILGLQIRRRIGRKFGQDKMERGLRWYAAMRALQLRIMRLPKPQVKRGQYPE